MSNFVHPKPAGWTLFDLFLHEEANLLAEQLVKAPNADDGSTHAPSMQHIRILGTNGFGVKFDCPVLGSWTTPSAVAIAGPGGFAYGSVGSPLPLSGYATWTGSGVLKFGAGTTLRINNATLSVENFAAAEVDATSVVHVDGGAISVDGGGTIHLFGAATMEVDSSSSVQLAGGVVLVGAFAEIAWRRDLLPDAAADIDATLDTWRVRGVLTANRVYTARHTGSHAIQPGRRVRVYRTEDPGGGSGPDSHVATVKRQDGTALFVFAAGYHGWVDLENDGTKIVPIGWNVADSGALAGTGLYGN